MDFEFNPRKAGNYLFAVKYYKGTTVLSKLFSSLRYVDKQCDFLLCVFVYKKVFERKKRLNICFFVSTR